MTCNLPPYTLRCTPEVLKMGLRTANRPVVDSDGFVKAKVSKAEFGTATETVRRAKDDVDSRTYERFELGLDAEGTTGVIHMTLFAGVVLNGPISETGKGKTKKVLYNRLTSVALSLGLVKPEDLAGTISDATKEAVETGLLGLVGKSVKFKLGRVEGKALTVPVPDSIVFA